MIYCFQVRWDQLCFNMFQNIILRFCLTTTGSCNFTHVLFRQVHGLIVPYDIWDAAHASSPKNTIPAGLQPGCSTRKLPIWPTKKANVALVASDLLSFWSVAAKLPQRNEHVYVNFLGVLICFCHRNNEETWATMQFLKVSEVGIKSKPFLLNFDISICEICGAKKHRRTCACPWTRLKSPPSPTAGSAGPTSNAARRGQMWAVGPPMLVDIYVSKWIAGWSNLFDNFVPLFWNLLKF